MPREKAGCLFPDCGMKRAATVHVGYGDDKHEFVEEKKAGFGSARAPLNRRSETNGSMTGLSTAEFYRQVRVPDVKRAVGDGRRPCGLLRELDGTLREIEPSPDCTGWVEGIHEVAPRGRFGGLKAALKAGATVDCCHACNQFWSRESAQAVAAGLLMKNRGPTRTQNSWDARPLFDQDEEEA